MPLLGFDEFEWNGVNCSVYGIHVLQQPTYIRPKERYESVTIPGRSGALTMLEGDDVYDALQISCTCMIHNTDDSRVEQIDGWLRGSGTLKFATRPNGFYKGRLSQQIPYSQLVRGNPHMSFQLQFDCEPYFYLVDAQTGDQTVTTYTMPSDGANYHVVEVTNLGNVPSLPLIKVNGTGDASIKCSTQEVNLTSIETTAYHYIVLDSEAKVAYTGVRGSAQTPLQLVGTHVQGDWLSIPTGTQQLIISSGITSIELTPRWRCI